MQQTNEQDRMPRKGIIVMCMWAVRTSDQDVMKNKTVALPMSSWKFDNDTLGKQHCFQSVLAENTVAGRAQQGCLSDEAQIAWDEDTNEFNVMLSGNYSSTVNYDKLCDTDQKVFDGARKKEMQGLLDLKAYRIRSLEESRISRAEHVELILPSTWVDREGR